MAETAAKGSPTLLHRAQASQPLAGNAGPGGEETPSPHVLATRLHLDRQPLCPSLPSSPHMLTCQCNSLTAVAPRPPKLVTDKAPSQTHRPPRCPPGTGLAGPLCLGQTPGSLRASEAGPRLPPRPRAPPAPRLRRRELRGPRLGPRDAALLGPRPPEPAHRRSAGSRCRPCGPPAPPSLSLFHSLLLSGRRRPGPPVSAEPCAPPCSPHLRGGLRPAALCTWPRPGCPPASPAPEPPRPLVQAARGRPS